MDASREAARQLEIGLRVLESSAVQDGDAVDVPALRLKVRVAQADVTQAGAIAVYEAGPRDGNGMAIAVLAVGYGDTPEKSLGEAAFQWTTGVFAVIRHWLQPAVHTCFVDDLHFLTRIDETGEEFGWRVHLGPVLSRTFGDASDGASDVGNDTLAYVRALFDLVQPVAMQREPFWIEAFAVRYPDGRIDSTCRLLNDDWPEGAEALTRCASEWRVNDGTMVSVRQFLLFEPVAPDELSKGSALRASLERLRPRKAPWWKRVFSGPPRRSA